MTMEFQKEYNKEKGRMKDALFWNNPNKYMSCDYLVRLHQSRGDKIIIFCDHIFSLKEYAERLMIPAIYGAVSDRERINII